MRGSMLAVLTLALLPPPAAAGSGLLLTVGDVTPTAAVVWVRAPAAADVAVEVTADELPVVATARMSVGRHHAELVRHQPTPGFSFHEFIAGPLAARPGRPRPLDRAPGSRSLFARGGVFNVGHVVIEPTHLTVRLVDDRGTVDVHPHDRSGMSRTEGLVCG